MPIRVLLVDDHPAFNQGVRGFLSHFIDEIVVIGEANNGRQGIAQALQLKPDVVLMDLGLPDMLGTQATKEIRKALPDTEVLCLTAYVDVDSVIAAIRAGAIGYVVKTADPHELRAAIATAAAGQVHLAPTIATHLFRQLPKTEVVDLLSVREGIILHLLAQGSSDAEIASALHASEQVARGEIQIMMSKLNVQSRFHAALYAVQIGLVQVREIAEGAIQSVQYPYASELSQPGRQPAARVTPPAPVLANAQEIAAYHERLAASRRRLGNNLLQQARFGIAAASHLVEDNREARKEIAHLKQALRSSGEAVTDHPDDESLSS